MNTGCMFQQINLNYCLNYNKNFDLKMADFLNSKTLSHIYVEFYFRLHN